MWKNSIDEQYILRFVSRITRQNDELVFSDAVEKKIKHHSVFHLEQVKIWIRRQLLYIYRLAFERLFLFIRR